MRCFAAIDIPEALARALDDVSTGFEDARTLRRVGMHLTLAFLGDVTEREAVALHRGLETLRAVPVPLCLRGLRTYRAERQIVFAIAADANPELIGLRAAIRRAARRAGIPLTREKYTPCVTLARAHQPIGQMGGGHPVKWRAVAPPPEFDPLTIHEFGLFKSNRDEGGSGYERLAKYTLKGNEAAETLI